MVGSCADVCVDFWVVDCRVLDCVCGAEVEVLKGALGVGGG